MNDSLKIAVIGAASSQTLIFARALVDHAETLPVGELWLVDDAEGQTLALIGEAVRRIADGLGEMMEVHVTTKLREALDRADFVLTQIRVGGFEADIIDETLPAKFNMLGDATIGIGGISRALRTIPRFQTIIRETKACCPHAWVINITEPIGIIAESVARQMDVNRIIGIGDTPVRMMVHHAEREGIPVRNLIPYIGGLDRLSFVFGMYVNHRERLKDFIKALGQGTSPYTDAFGYDWDTDFIQKLGVLPNPHVRCLIDKRGTYDAYVDRMEHDLIKAETARRREEEILNQCSSRQWSALCETLDEHDQHDTCHLAVRLIDDMHNDNKTYHVVNTLNDGFIPDLPNGAAVEITARITKHGPIPVYIGRLPDAVRGMVQHMKSSEHLLVDAICEHDLGKARFAAQMHPLTASIHDAGRAFDALLAAHDEHLRYYGEDKVCD